MEVVKPFTLLLPSDTHDTDNPHDYYVDIPDLLFKYHKRWELAVETIVYTKTWDKENIPNIIHVTIDLVKNPLAVNENYRSVLLSFVPNLDGETMHQMKQVINLLWFPLDESLTVIKSVRVKIYNQDFKPMTWKEKYHWRSISDQYKKVD